MTGKKKENKEYNPAWGGSGRGQGRHRERFFVEVGDRVEIEYLLLNLGGVVKSVSPDGLLVELDNGHPVTIQLRPAPHSQADKRGET